MEDNKSAGFSNPKTFDPLIDVKYNQTDNINIEKSHPDFFYQNIKQSYPLYRYPRGLCLIINIYQIHNMPPRRWSERDTDTLRQLFEQLMFDVNVYTDSTHDLTAQSLKQIIKDFSKRKEHESAQCCIICLMSHGEEGYLTSKEGDKLPLDDIFNLFNNVNCPNLAGKPKLFFIQSCRDDPISGPSEDLGIILNRNSENLLKVENDDETDGNQQSIYHMPSLCDMLIGFPTQKGFIAYRKPEIGSWYMNAIVQVFSKHAKNTDLCAMLNMVNALISNEVTNTGKKQMSEYTSKFTKPYFYFFPGLYLKEEPDICNFNNKSTQITNDIQLNIIPTLAINSNNFISTKRKLNINEDKKFLFKQNTINLNKKLKYENDSCCNINAINLNYKNILTHKHKMFISKKARNYWKSIAREMNLSECDINNIDYSIDDYDLSEKLYRVICIWIENNGCSKATLSHMIDILSKCKLNSIKEEFIINIQESENHSIIDEI